jgi:hypothetical protein
MVERQVVDVDGAVGALRAARRRRPAHYHSRDVATLSGSTRLAEPLVSPGRAVDDRFLRD